ncbi:unnamed protein product [Urochloa humidicola]
MHTHETRNQQRSSLGDNFSNPIRAETNQVAFGARAKSAARFSKTLALHLQRLREKLHCLKIQVDDIRKDVNKDPPDPGLAKWPDPQSNGIGAGQEKGEESMPHMLHEDIILEVEDLEVAGVSKRKEQPEMAGANENQRIFFHGGCAKGDEDAEVEYEYEAENETEKPDTWLSVARFYSRQKGAMVGQVAEMNSAWGLMPMVPGCASGDERILVEFSSENMLKKVDGSQCKRKDDTLGYDQILDLQIGMVPQIMQFTVECDLLPYLNAKPIIPEKLGKERVPSSVSFVNLSSDSRFDIAYVQMELGVSDLLGDHNRKQITGGVEGGWMVKKNLFLKGTRKYIDRQKSFNDVFKARITVLFKELQNNGLMAGLSFMKQKKDESVPLTSNLKVDGESQVKLCNLPPRAKLNVKGYRKLSAKGLGDASRDINKQKRTKMVIKLNLVQSIQELGKNGLTAEAIRIRTELLENSARGWEATVKDGESPAKRSRLSTLHGYNLTGAPGEPRQEQ